jgi:hypothetical protein
VVFIGSTNSENGLKARLEQQGCRQNSKKIIALDNLVEGDKRKLKSIMG